MFISRDRSFLKAVSPRKSVDPVSSTHPNMDTSLSSILIISIALEQLVTQVQCQWWTPNTTRTIIDPVTLTSINRMSNSLFRISLTREPGNFICSPLGVSELLAIAALGARGNTEKELTNALQMPRGGVIHGYQAIYNYLQHYTKFNSKLYMTMANMIFVSGRFPTINSKFRGAVSSIFKIEPQTLHFSDPEEASATINSWFERASDNQTRELVRGEDLNADIGLFLGNIFYFKGKWTVPFDPNDTIHRPFYLNNMTISNVPTMYQNARLNYSDLADLNLNATFVELPYEADNIMNKRISMFVIVPNEIESLEDIEKNIDKITLRRLQASTMNEVSVYLPRFQLTTTTEFKDRLVKLGIIDAFTDNADFHGIHPNGGLSISKIMQKTSIAVDEKGSEGIENTGVSCFQRNFAPHTESKIVKADHPFLVIIANRDFILFTARVRDPTRPYRDFYWK